jgi:cell division initiation protein
MLTPIEIQGKTFKNSGMGYSKADVDSFFTSISTDYENLYKENLEMKEKINHLNESLNHYKEIEKSLQKALVLAETTAEETIVGARKNATVIEQEAVLKAQTIVADAKVEIQRLNVKISDLLQQYDRYRAQYRALAAAQLEVLDSEAFHIEQSSIETMEGLEKTASEHVDQLQAAPVYQDAVEQAETEDTEEQEEDFDETLSTEDSMIKDFSAMFDDEHKE